LTNHTSQIRQGLLDMSEDEQYFVVNPALLEALTQAIRESLRKKAIERMAGHFGEDEEIIEALVEGGIG
jgi:phosphoenolpyruvate-protein kinase (PTS system EI component)